MTQLCRAFNFVRFFLRWSDSAATLTSTATNNGNQLLMKETLAANKFGFSRAEYPRLLALRRYHARLRCQARDLHYQLGAGRFLELLALLDRDYE